MAERERASERIAEGQCLCGNVRYQVAGSLGEVRYCHCDRCRRASGSAFTANAKVPADRFTTLSGQESIQRYEARPGDFTAFCSNCGSPLYATVGREPDHVRIRIGGLSGELDVEITAHVWVSSKSSWYAITDTLPCYPEAIQGPRPVDRDPSGEPRPASGCG
jgi:hypothetical protein